MHLILPMLGNIAKNNMSCIIVKTGFIGKDGDYEFPRLKRFLSELKDGIVPINLWNYKETGTIDDNKNGRFAFR